jgi:hypothetical protein
MEDPMKKLVKVIAMVAVSLYLVPTAQADDQGQAVPAAVSAKRAEAKAAFKAVIAKCEAQNNLSGSLRDLTQDQRKTVFQCVHKLRKAAKVSCEQSTGITLPPKGSGQKLSKEDRHTFHACMKKQGFGFRPHRHHKPQASQQPAA